MTMPDACARCRLPLSLLSLSMSRGILSLTWPNVKLCCNLQAPSMGRRAPASTAAKPAAGSAQQAAAAGSTEQAGAEGNSSSTPAAEQPASTAASVAGAVPESAPEPFAREAKHFAETKALNRWVQKHCQVGQ